MHELGVTRSILEIVLRHAEIQKVRRVLTVHLRIGALSDLEGEWLQSYFDMMGRGTVAEGAELRVCRSPITFSCDGCGRTYSATREELDSACCPACGSREASVESGTGYTVESMEAE